MLVAAGASCFAWWQTREAGKARVAAQKQAVEAEKSRKAAEVQARAAEEQVALMRAERDDRDAPEFSVSAVDSFADGTSSPETTSYFVAKVELRMDRGPALHSVKITASGDYIVQSGLHRFTYASGGIELTFDDIRPGSVLIFYVSTEDGYVGSAIALDLTCRERDGEDRTWRRHYAATIVQRRRPPHIRSTFVAD